MFNVVVDRRKRRAWSARTVAVSVGAHLLVLGGMVAAATNTRAAPPPPPPPDSIRWFRLKKPDPPAPVKPAPPQPGDRPAPVKGRTLALEAPTIVPPVLPPRRPDVPPTNPNDYTGVGPVGHGIGTPEPTPEPKPPTGETDPSPRYPTGVIPGEYADQLPHLVNPREAQRMLERAYPGILRDAGITGHTTVLLVIDRNGAVEPGSVTVQEATHDAFREAAVRAVERFRFRPARLRGETVAVSISLPIEWQIQP